MEIKISIILCTTISLSGVYISKCRDFRRRRRLYRTILYILAIIHQLYIIILHQLHINIVCKSILYH